MAEDEEAPVLAVSDAETWISVLVRRAEGNAVVAMPAPAKGQSDSLRAHCIAREPLKSASAGPRKVAQSREAPARVAK